MMSSNGKLLSRISTACIELAIKHGPRIAYAVEMCLGSTDLTAAVLIAGGTPPRL